MEINVKQWSKVMTIFGLTTSTVGYFMDSVLIILIGLLSSIIGAIVGVYKK